MVQLQRDAHALPLTFRGRQDGYGLLFEGKPVGVLRMKRRSIDEAGPAPDPDPADEAEAVSSDGRWTFRSRDIRKGLHIVDTASGEIIGSYRRVTTAEKAQGELDLFAQGTYTWELLEADPNQVASLAASNGDLLLKILSYNNLDEGRLLIEDPAIVESPVFSLLLLLSLYLYLRPVPGAKAVVPSR